MTAPGRKRLSEGRRIAVIGWWPIGGLKGSLSERSLFRDLEGVVDFDSQITHATSQLGVAEQQLDRPEVLRPPID